MEKYTGSLFRVLRTADMVGCGHISISRGGNVCSSTDFDFCEDETVPMPMDRHLHRLDGELEGAWAAELVLSNLPSINIYLFGA